IAIYVYCCNARISFHNVYSKWSSTRVLFVNCPSVICLPSMLYLYGETPLVNCGPRSYFPYCSINHHKSSIYFLAIYSLSDKIDTIMSMLVNGNGQVYPNNVPLASLVAQEDNVDVNFIKSNNFNNNAYRNNFGSNNYRPYPSNNSNYYGNSYGNSY